jgi:pyridoxine kinase
MSVISIQSRVVYGHVGNSSAAVFPMQMHGIEVMAVPTTLFSNRPRYPTVRGQVLDAGLVVVRAMKRNPKVIYCCDPVIGDAERGVFVAHGLPELFWDRLCPIAERSNAEPL